MPSGTLHQSEVFYGELQLTATRGPTQTRNFACGIRPSYQSKEKDYHPTLHNIAADLVVNQYVAPWPLPGVHITLDTFLHLRLQPYKSLDYYYEKILGLYQELMKMENSEDQSSEGGSPEMKISKGEARKNKEAKESMDALKSFLNNDDYYRNDQWEENGIKELSKTEITILQEALEEFIEK